MYAIDFNNKFIFAENQDDVQINSDLNTDYIEIRKLLNLLS
jgi:hypothetical protein